MASLILTPENQIQRLNQIINKVETLEHIDLKELISPPRPKSWSIIEIISHLNNAYEVYVPKIDHTLLQLPDKLHEASSFRARPWQRFVIASARPKNNKRKLKIKTLKKFEPKLKIKELDEFKVKSVFEKFKTLHLHLKHSILESRQKDTAKIKISSGIGPIIKFYLPESFEFLIVHMERHMTQIDEVLQK